MDGSMGCGDVASRLQVDLGTIETWLTAHVAQLVQQSDADIDVTLPFSAYALSSIDTIGLTAALEDWLGVSLEPTLVWDHPSITALARHLALGMKS